jgi:hypothetical protein
LAQPEDRKVEVPANIERVGDETMSSMPQMERAVSFAQFIEQEAAMPPLSLMQKKSRQFAPSASTIPPPSLMQEQSRQYAAPAALAGAPPSLMQEQLRQKVIRWLELLLLIGFMPCFEIQRGGSTPFGPYQNTESLLCRT